MEENIIKRIEKISREIDKKSYKKYRVKLLQRVAFRLDAFEKEGCKSCEELKLKLETIVILLEAHIVDNTPVPKEYFKRLNLIMGHLRREHKLVEEGYYIGQYMVYGMIGGLVSGNIYGNGSTIGIGASLGIVAGLLVGAQVDRVAKKNSRVL